MNRIFHGPDGKFAALLVGGTLLCVLGGLGAAAFNAASNGSPTEAQVRQLEDKYLSYGPTVPWDQLPLDQTFSVADAWYWYDEMDSTLKVTLHLDPIEAGDHPWAIIAPQTAVRKATHEEAFVGIMRAHDADGGEDPVLWRMEPSLPRIVGVSERGDTLAVRYLIRTASGLDSVHVQPVPEDRLIEKDIPGRESYFSQFTDERGRTQFVLWEAIQDTAWDALGDTTCGM